MLEKSYFCSITNSHAPKKKDYHPVVICLKNRTFAVSQTAVKCYLNQGKKLWFAWKIVLLQYHKQQSHLSSRLVHRCDLLEKSYFCSITNSIIFNIKLLLLLWFAWKIVLLQYHKQPAFASTNAFNQLWFAWKIVLLQYHKQPSCHVSMR